MAHVLHSVTGTKVSKVTEPNGDGTFTDVEKNVPIVREVTFMIDRATPHTLKFLDAGTIVKDGRGVERVVGDAETPYHEFSSEQDAISAYLDGKV